MKKAILIELAWLVGLFVIAYLLYGFIFSNWALDVREHDTYYNAEGTFYAWVPSFTLVYFISLAFCVYFGKAIYFGFRQISTNLILIVLTGLALFYINLIYYTLFPPDFSHFQNLNTTAIPSFNRYYFFDRIRTVGILKIILTLIIAGISFLTGYQYKSQIRREKSAV